MKRNANIELFRMMLMFGIVLLHTSAHAFVFYHWLQYSMDFCVTGFVFISGYYGIKFSCKKIIKLYCTAIVCVLISGLTDVCSGRVDGLIDYIALCHRHLLGCWFVHAYAVLMLISPMINAALEKNGWEWPFVFVAFVWSYLSSFGVTSSYLPTVIGFGSHTPLTLVGVYVVARRFSRYGLAEKIPLKIAVPGAIGLLIFGCAGFSRYNSAFAVVLSALLFVTFSKAVSLPVWASRMVLCLSPSVFSIYVLHNSVYNEYLTARLGEILYTKVGCALACIIFSAMATYLACLLVDCLRRLLVSCFYGHCLEMVCRTRVKRA